jgi:hypothetical protein
VRAIMREHDRPHAEAVATTLTHSLRQVCEDFLARQQPQESDAGR